MVHWWRFFFTETVVIVGLMALLGYLKLPRFLRKRKLVKGFPWGYYPDALPQAGTYFQDNDSDFLHDVGTGFGGMEGFGDYGEFSGFGEMGEFGSGFGGMMGGHGH